MKRPDPASIKALSPHTWELPRETTMQVPARFIGNEDLLKSMGDPSLLAKARDAASFPGAAQCAWLLPNADADSAFPRGCVVATDPDQGGVVVPLGPGADVYCGVRLLALDITVDEIRGQVPDILESLARAIPTRGRATGHHVATTLRRALEEGAPWAIDQGYGFAADLKAMESKGSLIGADAGILTDKALAFAGVHLGTLGGGQHFVELGCIETIYDGQAALAYGLKAGQVVILIHSGSRGLGQQILSDYQSILSRASARHLIRPPARLLFCAPAHSHEGREYLGAMACAANFAFANRQIIAHRASSAIATALDRPRESLGLRTIYEQCHNTIALEVHDIQGLRRRVCVHRRGASIVLPPGHNGLPPEYHFVGQPIIIAGHWTTESYLCVPGRESRNVAFGSCPAGAGFNLSPAARAESPRAATPENVLCIRADHRNAATTNDTPRDMSALLDTLETTKMARRAARIRPLGVLRS